MEEEGSNKHKFEDPDNKLKRAGANLFERMDEASALLVDSEEDKDSYNSPGKPEGRLNKLLYQMMN